jgi:hypothetical protein
MTQETPPADTDQPASQPVPATEPAAVPTTPAPVPPAKVRKPMSISNLWISFFVAVFIGFMVLSFVFNGSSPPGCLHGSGWTGPCISRNDGFHILWRTKTNGTYGG